METVLFFLISIVASTVGAISGIGGGILIKAVLDVSSRHSVATISFLSGCTVLSMAVISVMRSRKQSGVFELRRGTMLATGSAVGGLVGSILFEAFVHSLNNMVIGMIQSSLLNMIMIGLLINIRMSGRIRTMNLQGNPSCLCLGLLLGFLSSFLGIGGGPMNMAALTVFLSMDLRKAVFHSIYIILFSQASGLLLTMIRGLVPQFPPQLLVAMILGGVMGALVGGKLSTNMQNHHIKILYTAVMGIILCLSGGNVIRYAISLYF